MGGLSVLCYLHRGWEAGILFVRRQVNGRVVVLSSSNVRFWHLQCFYSNSQG